LISKLFNVSKGNFKKAIGGLFKQGLIVIHDDRIEALTSHACTKLRKSSCSPPGRVSRSSESRSAVVVRTLVPNWPGRAPGQVCTPWSLM
jgi:hypothetical protein